MAERDMQELELPIEGVGARLRRAREAAGLSRADIAARTKIAERHLLSIEEGRLSDLASRTYAVGFSRTYARAVGLDEQQIAQAVREELAVSEQPWELPTPTFEPGDPARVPPSRFAWIAGLGALAVIALVFALWRGFFDPAVSLPDLGSGTEDTAPAEGAAPLASAAPGVTGGAVVFTATAPNVWVKFYDAQGVQFMQKELAEGESYTVPADAEGPQLWTARPDALAITVGGKRVPALSDKPVTMKDVPVSAAALLGAGSSAVPAATSAPAATATTPARRATTASALPARVARPVARAPEPAPRQSAAPASRPTPVMTSSAVVQPLPKPSAADPNAAARAPAALNPAEAEASTVSD